MKRKKKKITFETVSTMITQWMGSAISIIVHTIFFIGIFLLKIVGVKLDQIMLILTTAVSLEAIYLSLFIQMTVNRNTQSLEDVEDDIDEIQHDVDEIDINKNIMLLTKELQRLQKEVSSLKRR